MASCYVNMNGEIALIWTLGHCCWLIKKQSIDQIEKEPAPQMHNIHIGTHVEEFDIDDEYPFPKIKEIFKKKIPVVALIDAIFMAFTPEACDGMQQVAVVEARRVISGEYGQHALTEVRKLFLEHSMTGSLRFNRVIVDAMPAEVMDFLHEAHHKFCRQYLIIE